MLTRLFASLVFCCSLYSVKADKPAVAIVIEEAAAPANFDYIGTYVVTSVVKMNRGKAVTSALSDVQYRIYSNGKEVKVYRTNIPDSFHSYEIYRSDGISEEGQQGNLIIKPGIQARHVQSAITKHLSVTKEHLTMTQFPPISDTVIITYAKRLELKHPSR